MSFSKYCPTCGRIVTCNLIPKYCPWGCASLQDEPLLPKDWQYSIDYFQMVEKARKEYEKRMKQKAILKPFEVEPGKFQLTLF